MDLKGRAFRPGALSALFATDPKIRKDIESTWAGLGRGGVVPFEAACEALGRKYIAGPAAELAAASLRAQAAAADLKAAQTRREIERIEEKKRENEIERGLLIERTVVEGYISRVCQRFFEAFEKAGVEATRPVPKKHHPHILNALKKEAASFSEEFQEASLDEAVSKK